MYFVVLSPPRDPINHVFSLIGELFEGQNMESRLNSIKEDMDIEWKPIMADKSTEEITKIFMDRLTSNVNKYIPKKECY